MPDAIEPFVAAARAELLSRVAAQVAAERLTVDYYRIRRRISWPLPIEDAGMLAFPVRQLTASYPWDTWMSWALEERLMTLGWAGEWEGEERCRELVGRDLIALAGWRRYGPGVLNGLPLGHFMRTMARALHQWAWLPASVDANVRNACSFVLDSYRTYLREERQGWENLAEGERERTAISNIVLIGKIGLALAGRLIADRDRDATDAYVAELIRTTMRHRSTDSRSEGICYDGYVLDFVADWLDGAPDALQAEVLAEPGLREVAERAACMGAPGDLMIVPPLGDVEPLEMPFHVSGSAKLLGRLELPRAAWYLRRLALTGWRADALGAIGSLASVPAAEEPPLVVQLPSVGLMRTGWEAGDLAVAMSAHDSRQGHLQGDNGSIVIGKRGRWLIDDPGYQQYLETAERTFTLGTRAHNHPVVHGHAAALREARLPMVLERDADGARQMLDISACYPDEAGVERAVRSVWLASDRLVIVADRLRLRSDAIVSYAWHGHAEAGWWAEDGRALIEMDGDLLWIRCLQQTLTQADINRLPGSRGQLTLCTTLHVDVDATIVWAFGSRTAVDGLMLKPDGLMLRLGDGRRLALS